MLANHPARKGIDSPHEIRALARRRSPARSPSAWRAPPATRPPASRAPIGTGRARGFYDNSPSADSFAGYPLESYRTWGGFDWMTATVGGLWDSLLAEGKPWWITANSDSHTVYTDTAVRGPNSDFDANGRYDDPVYGGDGRPHRRRLLARPLQPHPRRRRRLLLRRGHGRHPGRPGLGRPRRPDQRPRRAGRRAGPADPGVPLGGALHVKQRRSGTS